MRNQNGNTTATYAEVLAAIHKLNNDTASLQRAVNVLSSRLRADVTRPEEGEPISVSEAVDVILAISKDRGKQELTTLRDAVVGFRMLFDNMQRDISMIRAHMDAVANDAELSDEYKRYWKNDNR